MNELKPSRNLKFKDSKTISLKGILYGPDMFFLNSFLLLYQNEHQVL